MKNSDRDARALAQYHYTSASDSLVSAILKRVWFMPILERTPRGIPANAITLVAFVLASCAAAALLCYRMWPARALLVLAGLALSGYGTLDNIDGSQARRNGTSGPIGEFLDHGTDSIVMFIIPLVFGMVWLPPALLLGSVGVGSIAFWSSMWAHHRIGKLPTTLIADVECVLVVSSFLVAMGVFGPETFEVRIGEHGPTAIELLIAGGVLGSLRQIAFAAHHVPSGGRVRALCAASAPHALLMAWYLASDGAIGATPCALLMGLLGARGAVRMILARLYRRAVRPFDPIAIAIALVGLGSALIHVGEQRAIAHGLCWAVTVSLAAWFVIEIRAMARTLGVRIFAAIDDGGRGPASRGDGRAPLGGQPGWLASRKEQAAHDA